jgi:hypothetical protein
MQSYETFMRVIRVEMAHFVRIRAHGNKKNKQFKLLTSLIE